MSIESITDPRTGEDVLFAKGKITGIYFNEIKHVKTYTNKKGTSFTPTHVINVKVGDTNVSFGSTDKKVVNTKHNGDWLKLQKGMTITVDVTKQINGKYTNYNADKSTLKVLDATAEPSVPSNAGGNKGSGSNYKKRDNSGIECGHALNGAMRILNGKMVDEDEFLELAKKVHDATTAVKKTHADNNPDMDDYSVGASSGNAVLLTCDLLTKSKVDLLEEKAISFLSKFSEPLLRYIRGEDVQEEPEGDEEFDDDIPFS